MRRFLLFWVAPPTVLLAFLLAPVVAGSETFFLRDVMSVHAGLRAGLDAAGTPTPIVDPLRGGGQPAAGNPNVVALHPSALLHRLLPFFPAFNLHLALHLLAAPFALFWLARELGLGRRAAWVAAVAWGFSGFVLSQAAFFNVVAAVAIAPALAAAAVGAARRLAAGRAAGRHLAATGVLAALVLVGGDPVTAAAALLAAAALAAAEARGERRRSALGWTAAAFLCGAALALPQLVELLRALPASARGAGYGEAMRTAGSWDPRQAIEQLLPLAFGRPDLLASDLQAGVFWGHRFHQGSWSFHFSLYPGLAAFALAAAAGRAWRLPGALGRAGRRGWALIAAGLFFALGAFNPLVTALLALPGADATRFPVKLWLWVAMGLALVAGVGFERLLAADGDGRAAGRRALATLGALAGLFAALALVCKLLPGTAARALQAMMPPGVPLTFAGAEAARWAGLAAFSCAAASLLAGAVLLAARRPAEGGALLVLLAAAVQLFALRPLLATEPTAIYRRPPPVLAALPTGARIAHGAAGALFGPDPPDEGDLPTNEARWVFRRTHEEAYPHAGALFAHRYDLVTTPEGLDTAALHAAIAAVRAAPSDAVRLRLLAAWGVDRLLLGRPLASEGAEEVWRRPSYGRPLRVYRLEDAAPEVYLATARVHLRRGAPEEAAIAVLADERFVPGRSVVLEAAGRPPAGEGAAQVEWTAAGERLAATTRGDRPTILVWQRAWLPHYLATVDGRMAEVKRVNLYRIGVEVPTGEHEVEIWIDRAPTRWSWLGTVLGTFLLALLARRRPV